MGSKMKSKFGGTCTECGTTWKEGDEICYSKDQGENGSKIVCSDEKCAVEQGWKLSEQKPFFKSGGSNYQPRPVKTIEQKIGEVDIAYNRSMDLLKDFTTKCGSLDAQQSAIFVESMTRTMIQA